MALSAVISNEELRRVAIRSYEGRTLWVRLCNIVTETFDENSSVSLWQTIELPETNGYAPFSAVIGTGSYDPTTARYKLPSIDAPFSADGGVITWNTVLLYIEDYVIEEETKTGTNISFQTTTNTITETTGDFTTLFSANEYIQVEGSSAGLNDGIYEIASVTPLVITLSSETPLAAAQAAGASVTLTRASLYPYALLQENPNITLIDGQTQTYRVILNTDENPF